MLTLVFAEANIYLCVPRLTELVVKLIKLIKPIIVKKYHSEGFSSDIYMYMYISVDNALQVQYVQRSFHSYFVRHQCYS